MYRKLLDNYRVQREKHTNRKFVGFEDVLKGGFLSGVSHSVQLMAATAVCCCFINTVGAVYRS